MRNLAVFGCAPGPTPSFAGSLQEVTLDATTLRCGIVSTPPPRFDRHAPERRGAVLVRTLAFSCNYRDRGFGYVLRRAPAHRFFVLGSEFVAEVMDTGDDVVGLRSGDRVIADMEYVGGGPGPRQGVLSNNSSREYHIFPARNLVPVPRDMPDEVAAVFALNAQTAYSMVRRAAPEPGANVLVTSARSNTSLFIIGALRRRRVNVYAATTSARFADRLTALGVKDVVTLERGDPGTRPAALIDLATRLGGFECVFDPMFDAHIDHAALILAPFGRYVTCGLVGQNPSQRATGVAVKSSVAELVASFLTRNLTLIGNCVGRSGDLRDALADYEAGTFAPVIDSVFSGNAAAPFLDRTFNDPDRFGKVVFRYN